jgi:hypothetical protein
MCKIKKIIIYLLTKSMKLNWKGDNDVFLKDQQWFENIKNINFKLKNHDLNLVPKH